MRLRAGGLALAQLPSLDIEISEDLAHPCLRVLWPQVLDWGRWCRGGGVALGRGWSAVLAPVWT